ncbi:hypothetical protein [Paenisporosarcina quisquiliarum]|uniref:hypothetical protein n=1 Tax=Paenisporosarcina quisquiliarum TaxID=365346 RepID=UPI003734ED8B
MNTINYFKWILILIFSLFVIWYTFEFIRYSQYDMKKQIVEVNDDILVLAVLEIKPDESYVLVEAKITDKTIITGMGIKRFLIDDITDLKHGQKVRVWVSEDENNIAVKRESSDGSVFTSFRFNSVWH